MKENKGKEVVDEATRPKAQSQPRPAVGDKRKNLSKAIDLENLPSRCHAIRVSDPRLPPLLALPKATASREEIASSRLSLEEEIDQFQLEEERKKQGDPVIHVSYLEDKFDKTSGVRTLSLIVAKVDDSFEEEDAMALNPRKGLKDILVGRNKGSSSKEALKSQLPPTLLPI
nr:hypothetical protein CFP56_60423 [Quercus suber]